MNDILAAAIGGGFGGLLGGLAGAGIDRLRKKPSRLATYAGLALALVGARTAVAVTAPSIEQQLEASPAIRAIHRYYPETFAQMAASLKGVDTSDQIALQDKIRPQLAALVATHHAQTDDASAEALGRLMLDETAALQAKSPEACAGLLTGGQIKVDMRTAMSPDILKRDSEVTAKLIEQVATHPAAPPTKLTDSEGRALAARALKKLSNEEAATVTPLLEQQRQPSNPREAHAYCSFYRAFFQSALETPGGVMRRLLAG